MILVGSAELNSAAEEQHVISKLHIEGGGPIYEVSHHIGSKKVERVSLVAFGAAQSKVIAKITLKALTLTLSNRFAE